jgi:serine/threonine protein kinase, bacterial
MTATLLNNRYQILRTLGRGGFGETFLATDTHMPSGKKCVIKQLNPIIHEPTIPEWMQERFQREAAILEELGEKNEQIPRLYAYFSEEEKFYLVQEWVEGETLAEKQQQKGKLSAKEVKEILIKILPVLDYVHSRHIVHRDIKPDNIILRSGDSLPVLIDFGIVKEALATAVNTSTQAPFSAAIGTPGYMASEQAAGRPVYSSDLYSLALTAVFLLTGKEPRDLKTDPKSGEIIWRDRAPMLDGHLALVLEKATRFHPRDRFASASEMLTALRSPSGRRITPPTGATAVVSPGNSSDREAWKESDRRNDSLTGKTHAVASPSVRQGNGLMTLALSLFLVAGVSLGAFAVGFNLLRNMWRSPQVTEKPVFPIEKSPQVQPQQPIQPSIDREKKPETGKPQEEQTPPENSQFPSETNTESHSENPTQVPDVIVANAPQATPEKTQTQSPPENQTAIRTPTLGIGDEANRIVSSLGDPTSERQSVIGRDRVLSYKNFDSDRVDVSYTSDNKTGRIKQTEVAFNQSLSIDSIEKTLANMLGGNVPEALQAAIGQVYEGQTDMRSLDLGQYKAIVRNQKDRIYVGIWAKNNR